jgi:hypothetical protein
MEGTVMDISFDAIIKAALKLSEGERWELVSRIMETVPPEGVTMSIDDPLLPEELR